MSKFDLLLEVGTEELPPKSLFTLAAALADGIVQGLDAAAVGHGSTQWFATPRRLAVRISDVSGQQPSQEIRRQGPAVANAFNPSGHPTKAALGFAASCGVAVEELQQIEGPKGKVLQFVGVKPGQATSVLLPEIVSTALNALPVAKRMRWGTGDQEFVRPVHWMVLLLGSTVIEAEILGVKCSNQSHGHRFHAPQPITITSPARYPQLLQDQGHVIVDVNERRERIRSGVVECAAAVGGTAVIEEGLLDEVTALVEWPVPLAGRFDEGFLKLPEEVLIATMQEHQRYFPVRDANGRLKHHFITVANIESRDPDRVRDGNERVVRPRLADAAFFWETDRKQRLESRCEGLKTVTFQNKLGSLFDKSKRVARLARRIAELIGSDTAHATRAAELCKCDLLSLMVGEFPELQGLMGRYYALQDAEDGEVAAALEEQYWPRFSGDKVASTRTGMALAIADKLDTIAGVFCIGQKPSGTRDPYGLRRAALGLLRTIVERRLDLDLLRLVVEAVELQPIAAPKDVADEIWAYLMERLRGMYLEVHSELQVTTEMVDAVLASQAHSPLDIDARLRALHSFLGLAEAVSLAAANKRIANILRKSSADTAGSVQAASLTEPAEQQLFRHVVAMESSVAELLAKREYTKALAQLAGLRADVDRFFDSVMVMADDEKLRVNRLSLLVRLRGLFLQIADLSRLPG